MKSKRLGSLRLTGMGLVVLGLAGQAAADVGVGDAAPLFASIDENLQPVDMADLIQERPLVLAVGSAS